MSRVYLDRQTRGAQTRALKEHIQERMTLRAYVITDPVPQLKLVGSWFHYFVTYRLTPGELNKAYEPGAYLDGILTKMAMELAQYILDDSRNGYRVREEGLE